ncbi:MAG: transglutaminase domain-containing protein [Lachnospiraceae bacterium]|nr:transglutaminase domain-containing protein [Lachnospiraceae bacterium]
MKRRILCMLLCAAMTFGSVGAAVPVRADELIEEESMEADISAAKMSGEEGSKEAVSGSEESASGSEEEVSGLEESAAGSEEAASGSEESASGSKEAVSGSEVSELGELKDGLPEAENSENSEIIAPETEISETEIPETDISETDTPEAQTNAEQAPTSETDDLIEETETGTAGLLEEPADGMDQVWAEEDTGSLEDASIVTLNAEEAPAFALFSRSMVSYDGSYGNQLDSYALELYQTRVNYYAVQKNTGIMALTYNRNSSPFLFDAEVSYNETIQKNELNTKTEEVTDARLQVVFAMQSSLDAFVYDHPEIFWLRGGTYAIGYSAYKNSDDQWKGYVSKIIYTPGSAFDGAEALAGAYTAALDAVAASIRQSADYDGDGAVNELELAQAIHDYLCERFYYDNQGLNSYMQTGDYRIFCSAGAFLDSVGAGVVCEGYAKSYKVLCDKLGLPCVCIGGKVNSSGEGHMWNGVFIDGKWYLTDVTWDDSSSGISYKYFLSGDLPANRTGSGNFSGADAGLTTVFVYPALNNSNYIFRMVSETASTCTEDGSVIYTRCYSDKSSTTEKIPALGHGYENGRCIRCGASDSSQNIQNPETSDATDTTDATGEAAAPESHNYEKTVTPPTCMEAGYTSYSCSHCGDSYRDDPVNALGHSYEKTVTAPTCMEAGYTTYTCSRCPDSYRGDSTNALGHNYENGQCSRCGAYDSFRNASIASVGKQTYTGKPLTPAITVKFGTKTLVKGSDYKVEYQKNTNIGTASVTISGMGNYSGTRSLTFKITAKTVSGLKFGSISSKTYTGKNLSPGLVVKNGSITLKKGRDYTLTYSKNKNIGTAVVVVKGIGNYTGSKKVYFKIVPKKTSVKSAVSLKKKQITVTWKKISGVTGYQIQYSVSSKFSNAKIKSASSKMLQRTLSKLISKKNYYIRIRTYKKVAGKNYYSGWSSGVKIKVK